MIFGATVSEPKESVLRPAARMNVFEETTAAVVSTSSIAPHTEDGSNECVDSLEDLKRDVGLPCRIVKPVRNSNQSVTYSSWQVGSLNEVADALNISCFASVKHVTVEANVGASMIHESNFEDSQLKFA